MRGPAQGTPGTGNRDAGGRCPHHDVGARTTGRAGAFDVEPAAGRNASGPYIHARESGAAVQCGSTAAGHAGTRGQARIAASTAVFVGIEGGLAAIVGVDVAVGLAVAAVCDLADTADALEDPTRIGEAGRATGPAVQRIRTQVEVLVDARVAVVVQPVARLRDGDTPFGGIGLARIDAGRVGKDRCVEPAALVGGL